MDDSRVQEATLCHIINGNLVLLKEATRGISRGKWNGPGGKIEEGESAEESARREVKEETGLDIGRLFYHGILRFKDTEGNGIMDVHLFSTSEYSGIQKDTEEGVLRWFPVSNLPWDAMWEDDRFWFWLMLSKRRFDADFVQNDEGRIRSCMISILDLQ